VLQRGEQGAREVHVVKGKNGSLTPCLMGRWPFIDHSGSTNCGLVTLQPGLSYMTSGAQRLRMSVRRGRMGLPEHSSWFLGVEVDGARDDSW
jgi:hypothetical protein